MPKTALALYVLFSSTTLGDPPFGVHPPSSSVGHQACRRGLLPSLERISFWHSGDTLRAEGGEEIAQVSLDTAGDGRATARMVTIPKIKVFHERAADVLPASLDAADKTTEDGGSKCRNSRVHMYCSNAILLEKFG
jgi:hypothetical protein